MQPTTKQSLDAACAALVERASGDPQFRALCKQDPSKAFQEGTGLEWPENLKLRFVDLDADQMVIPLPPLVAAGAGKELSDQELQEVAGGTGAALALLSEAICAGLMLGALVVTGITALVVELKK